jgi:DHA1 family multidrug resistance protein-like MFS transporter
MSEPPIPDISHIQAAPSEDGGPAAKNGARGHKNAGRSWFRSVLPVAVIALCAEMGTSVLNNSTLPVYFEKGMKIGTDVLALIMIPFFISEALFKSPLGVLADKIGRKPLMLFGCLMTVFTPVLLRHVAYPALGIAGLIAFGTLRLLDGLGGAALWPSLFAYVGDEVPEEKRGSAMALLNVMYIVGLALSFYVGGKLDDNFDPVLTGQNSFKGQIHRIGHHLHEMARNLSDRVHHVHYVMPIDHGFGRDLLTEAMSKPGHYYPSMYLASFLFGLASIACVVGLRNKPPMSLSNAAEGENVTWESFVKALHNIPEFLGLAFVTFFGIGCIANLVKIFAVDEFHMTEEHVGLLMLVTATIIAGLAYPLGTLADRWGKSLSVRLGFILCAVGLWGIPILHGFHDVHETAFVFSAAVMGIGFVVAFPAWNALLTSLADASHRGTVFGAVSTCQGIGVLVGILVGGFLYKHAGHIAPFIASASFVTLGSVLACIFVRDSSLSARKREV